MPSSSGSPPLIPSSAPTAATPPPVVCVVDADQAVHAAVRRLLATLGAEVRGYESGRGLLAALAGGLQPAAAVIDMHLPDMSGVELLRHLGGHVPAVPAIMLTREADVATAVTAMRAGALDFIEKPHFDRALLKHIGPLLAGPAPVAG